MRLCPRLLIALLLTLGGCAVQRPVDLADQGGEWGRSPSWTLQARLHSALYGCELLALNGNNARLAGEQGRLPAFYQQLNACQAQALTTATSATGQLPVGQDADLRNAQQLYLVAWRDYLGSLSIEHPADLQRKQSYLEARAALLETATRAPGRRP